MKRSLEDCVDYNFNMCFGFSQNLKKEDVSARLPGKLIVRSPLSLGEVLLTLISFNDGAYFSIALIVVKLKPNSQKRIYRTKSYLRGYKPTNQSDDNPCNG